MLGICCQQPNEVGGEITCLAGPKFDCSASSH